MFKDDEYIKSFIDINYSSFEYVGGYTGCDGKLILRCKDCGYEFEYTSQILRPSRKYNIQCKECNIRSKESELLQKKLDKENKHIIKQKKILIEKFEKQQRLNNRVCNECGQVYNAEHINQKYCSIKCARRHENRMKEITRRKHIRLNGKVNWDISLDKLIKRDNNTCHICGGRCNYNDYEAIGDNFIVGKDYPSIDHVIPVSKGGTHTWDNIKLAHHYCNTIKNNKMIYEDGNGQLVIAI